MLRSRLLMLILAALLVAQSALGVALHRCHDDASTIMQNVAAFATSDTMPHCHEGTNAHDDTIANTTHSEAIHASSSHGICTCSIAHCAPALISHFEFASTPPHPTATPHYRFSVLPPPAESVLRPPIFLR